MRKLGIVFVGAFSLVTGVFGTGCAKGAPLPIAPTQGSTAAAADQDKANADAIAIASDGAGDTGRERTPNRNVFLGTRGGKNESVENVVPAFLRRKRPRAGLLFFPWCSHRVVPI